MKGKYLGGTVGPQDVQRLRVDRTLFPPAPIEVNYESGHRFVTASGTADAMTGSAEYEEVYSVAGQLPKGLWLRVRLPVHVRIEGPEYVADQPDVQLHAFGDSPVDAILNLRDRLVEHLERLETLGDRLAPRLAQQKALLQALIVRGNG